MAATRAFVTYNPPSINSNGFILDVNIVFLGTEIADGGATQALSLMLPADSPALWEGIIRDEIINWAAGQGWTLIATRIHVPQYKTLT